MFSKESNVHSSKNPNELKIEVGRLLTQKNQIVSRIWTIGYQLASPKFNNPAESNAKVLEEKTQLEKEKTELNALLKNNLFHERINRLYKEIKNLDNSSDPKDPYFYLQL